jgi:release factor glutamine methyltransferase
MDVGTWLARAEKKLAQAGVGTARLDGLVLLEDISGRERSWLLAHPECTLTPEQTDTLQKLLNRRAAHEPLAYLRGKTEFYGRKFVLTPAVLEPRPESESMVELLIGLHHGLETTVNDSKSVKNQSSTMRIADVGTGSGALGITAALECKNTSVDLLEIDDDAIKVAEMNVDLHTTSTPVIKSDLLQESAQDYDILLCNLPYVPDTHTINAAAEHEPHIAIFGGPDGLDLYRKLYKQIKNMQKRPLFILCESLPPQHAALETIAHDAGYTLLKTDDFIQVFAASRQA